MNIDSSNPVFDINGNATDVAEWTVFSLKDIWKTTSATFPDNECPVTNVEICEDDACNTLAVEADGVRITTDANGDFQFELDVATFDADPAITHYFRVSSFNVFLIEPFSVNLLDCTDQVVSLAGDALAPIEIEIGKNYGVVELLTQEYVQSLFAVSDPRPACAIYHYRIYLTATEELSASNDAALYARLQYASWDEKDGAVDVDSDIASAEATITAFRIFAEGQENSVVTDTITLTLSCIDVTAVTTTYVANSEPFVEDYSSDGHFFKVFVSEPGTSETVDLTAVATYQTDRPDCNSLAVVVVTDASGTTDSVDARFSVSDFVLSIATDAAAYESVYLKATSYVDTVFKVDKVLVTVCGNQVISNDEPSNAFFVGIERNQALAEDWETFSLLNVFSTASNVLPTNECPVTSMRVCEDAGCATVFDAAAGFRVVPNADDSSQFSVEINMNVVHLPEKTYHLEVTSFSVIQTFAFTLTVKDCSVQTITVVGEPAAGNIVRELGKNFGLQTLFGSAETASWFEVSDARAECAITGFHIYHTGSEELTSANAALWARLDGANYAEDGVVSIDTDISEAEITIQDFFIAARAPLIDDVLTSAVKVTLSCINVTSLTTTYDSANSV